MTTHCPECWAETPEGKCSCASPAENEAVVRAVLEAVVGSPGPDGKVFVGNEVLPSGRSAIPALAALRAQAEAGEQTREARDILDEETVRDFMRQFDRWKGSDEALDFAMYVIERLRAALPAREEGAE